MLEYVFGGDRNEQECIVEVCYVYGEVDEDGVYEVRVDGKKIKQKQVGCEYEECQNGEFVLFD